jgi:hypothetical protein
MVASRRRTRAEAFRAYGMIFYSPVPRSASSALKGNFSSSKAKSASEIVEAGGIDRSGERRVPEPLPKPISHRNPVEPQCRIDERLEKLVALRRVEPRPALHCGRDQIDAPHSRSLSKSGLGKRNYKNEKRKHAEGARSRGPPGGWHAPRDPRNE